MAEVPSSFVAAIETVTSALQGRALVPELALWLERQFPPGGEVFDRIEALCRRGCAEGWLCGREAGGIKYGRAVKPGDATKGFSVDVVDMMEVVGPHHLHPNGEIDMVMPVEGDARFDGISRGWKVYGPGSAHSPTVSGGRALVLYLLPDGAIEFTRV